MVSAVLNPERALLDLSFPCCMVRMAPGTIVAPAPRRITTASLSGSQTQTASNGLAARYAPEDGLSIDGGEVEPCTVVARALGDKK